MSAALAFEKAAVGIDVLHVPHLQLPRISDATIESLVVVTLLVALIAPIVGYVVGFIFGDLAPQSRFDRWATWIAKASDDGDGEPLVKPGEEPTPGQKYASVAYHVAMTAGIVWVLFLR